MKLYQKIGECYDKKVAIGELAELLDGMATSLVTENKLFLEEELRKLPELSAKAQAAFTSPGDRLKLKEVTDAMIKAGYKGLREALETEGKVPRGAPLRKIFLGEITLCACPCFETLVKEEAGFKF